LVIGFDLADHLNEVVDYIYAVTGWSPFPKDLYLLDKIPTVPVYTESLYIGGFAILVSVLAAVYPAVKAALFHPVEALRYE
ncbi:MAG: lipoprotein-releasing system transmembrane subunit LolC, partial [Planctomycetota bacterium]